MPCVAADEPTFEENNSWRGPVWVNLNWLTIRGLRHYHYDELADELERKSLDMIAGEPFPFPLARVVDPGKGLVHYP